MNRWLSIAVVTWALSVTGVAGAALYQVNTMSETKPAVGPPGPPGERGPQGPIGPQGESGVDGNNGQDAATTSPCETLRRRQVVTDVQERQYFGERRLFVERAYIATCG